MAAAYRLTPVRRQFPQETATCRWRHASSSTQPTKRGIKCAFVLRPSQRRPCLALNIANVTGQSTSRHNRRPIDHARLCVGAAQLRQTTEAPRYQPCGAVT